jgi:LEA14-like dessication related protein
MIPNKLLRHTGVLMILLALLAGCAGLPVKQPEIQISGISMGKSSMLEQEFKVDLLVRNPNSIALNAQGLYAELVINGKKIATANSLQPITVAAQGSGHVQLDLRASVFELLQQAGKATDSQGKIHYQINGYINSLVRIPFSRSGEWKMPH